MKSRLGFVSNSSSSSYIIDISRTLPEIIHEIDPPDSFYSHSLIPELEQDIKRLEDSLSEDSLAATDGFHIIVRKQYQSWVQEKTDLLELAKKYQKEPSKYGVAFVKKILSEHRIGVEEHNGHTIFTSMSIIHNSFNDLGGILSAICLWYLFNYPNLIIAKENHEG